MVELKYQYPYVDDQGKEHRNLIKIYAEDLEGNKYKVKQVNTGNEYEEAIDVVGYNEKHNKYYPLYYTYIATDISIEKDVEENENSTH